MPSPVVEVMSASRVFRSDGRPFEALRAASCRVLPGETIAITGPSGSGKSTLLNLLAGLDVPDSGDVAWPALGKIEDLRPDLVSLVPQMPSLVPWFTVLENVELPALLGRRAETARKDAVASLERLGLSGLLDKLPQELSGGQMQRIALARALVGGSRLLLADEPTGQLDGGTTATLFEALLPHLASRDIALVIATHDPTVAERMGTIWRIDHGRLDTREGVGPRRAKT